MTTNLLFLDIAPEPVASGISAVVLILIGVVALLFTAAIILASVFLLRRMSRAKATGAEAAPAVTHEFQPSNPNQP